MLSLTEASRCRCPDGDAELCRASLTLAANQRLHGSGSPQLITDVLEIGLRAAGCQSSRPVMEGRLAFVVSAVVSDGHIPFCST
jgi:hypothetical protein